MAFEFIGDAWDTVTGLAGNTIGNAKDSFASAANPAASRGTPRQGAGPNVNNYMLGGDPNWLAAFSNNAGNVASQAQGMAGQGGMIAQTAAQEANRGSPFTAYGQGVYDTQGRSMTGGAQQYQLADQLRTIAGAPQGPSAAQAQLQQGTNEALNSQLALARSGSGFGEAGNAMAAAQGNAAGIQASNANNAAQLRANEDAQFRARQLQALGMSGEQLAAGRGADLALGGQQIGQSQFDTQSALAGQQQNDALRLGLLGQGLDAQQAGIEGQSQANQLALQAAIAQQQGLGNYEGNVTDIYGMDIGAHTDARQQNQARSNDWVTGITGFVEGLGGLSDRRAKKNIEHEDLSRVYRALGGT